VPQRLGWKADVRAIVYIRCSEGMSWFWRVTSSHHERGLHSRQRGSYLDASSDRRLRPTPTSLPLTSYPTTKSQVSIQSKSQSILGYKPMQLCVRGLEGAVARSFVGLQR